MLKKDKNKISRHNYFSLCACGKNQIVRIVIRSPDMVLDFRSADLTEKIRSHSLYGVSNPRCTDPKEHLESQGVELIKKTHLEYEMQSHKSWNFPAKIMALAIVPMFGADFLPFADSIGGIIGITTGVGLSSWYVGRKAKEMNRESQAIKKTGSSYTTLEQAYLSTLSYLSEIEMYQYSLVVSEIDQIKSRIEKGEGIMDVLSDDNPIMNEIIEEISQLEIEKTNLENDIVSFEETALNNKEDDLSQHAIEFLTNDPRYKNL